MFIRRMLLGVKLNSRCFIRDGVTSIIFTEVTLKLYCVEVVDITYNIQYRRVNSLVHLKFFITLNNSGFESAKQRMRETLLFCFNLKNRCYWKLSLNYKKHGYCQINQVYQRQNAIFMLKIWCCVFGGIKKVSVVYHELLKLGETIIVVRYKQ